jgi:hypothetical protein
MIQIYDIRRDLYSQVKILYPDEILENATDSKICTAVFPILNDTYIAGVSLDTEEVVGCIKLPSRAIDVSWHENKIAALLSDSTVQVYE